MCEVAGPGCVEPPDAVLMMPSCEPPVVVVIAEHLAVARSAQSRLALSDAQLQKVVVGLPSVLGYSFESNIGLKLDYLHSTASLTLDEMRDRVVRNPAMLGYSQALRYRPWLDACAGRQESTQHVCSVPLPWRTQRSTPASIAYRSIVNA